MKRVAVYMRVSTRRQKTDSQRGEIERWLAGHDVTDPLWFMDKATGANTDRPGLQALQGAVFTGEVGTVVLYSFDRLARSLRDGVALLCGWLDQNIRVVVVTMQVDLSGAVGRMLSAIMLSLAELERERLRERQAAGIAAAKAAGKTWGGRKRGSFKVSPKRVGELSKRGLTQNEIATALGVSSRTVRRMMQVTGG